MHSFVRGEQALSAGGASNALQRRHVTLAEYDMARCIRLATDGVEQVAIVLRVVWRSVEDHVFGAAQFQAEMVVVAMCQQQYAHTPMVEI